jgi:hypothetical protein
MDEEDNTDVDATAGLATQRFSCRNILQRRQRSINQDRLIQQKLKLKTTQNDRYSGILQVLIFNGVIITNSQLMNCTHMKLREQEDLVSTSERRNRLV